MLGKRILISAVCLLAMQELWHRWMVPLVLLFRQKVHLAVKTKRFAAKHQLSNR